MFRKKKILISGLLLVLFITANAQTYPGFRVQGRHLYDKCGERVILRGISNPNIWFEKDGIPRYAEIDQTGANVVRIVWETWGTAQELDEAITNCIELNMIPMVELHDATGDLSKLPICVDYWTSSEVLDVISWHEEYLLLNIANEPGVRGTSGNEFRTAYTTAINDMRNAGIHVPLIIDGADWGKDIDILQAEGPGLIESDPDHNLMFSVHMWWPEMYGYSESDIVDEIAESIQMNLPLIVGEFSQMHGDCDDNTITDQNSIAYKTIIRECHENQIGYIAWSWFGNCNSLWDMSTEGTYATLYDWGLEVAVTDENSIKNTSKRPYYIINGACNPDNIEYILTQPQVVNLMQNFPNPFNESTRIEYHLLKGSLVELVLLNHLGEEIRSLVDGFQSAGSYTIEIKTEGLDAGIYFFSFKTGDYIQTGKMLIVE